MAGGGKEVKMDTSLAQKSPNPRPYTIPEPFPIMPPQPHTPMSCLYSKTHSHHIPNGGAKVA